jgi:hypothetical protein
MRRITEEDLTIREPDGTPHPPRVIAVKLVDTILRTLIVVGLLVAVGLLWGAFH